MTIYTDNKDFYPTPKTLFHRLIGSRRLHSGKVLEPSAGKGDMIKHIAEISRRRSFAFVDAIENDSRLVSALMGEGISVVWDDFLTYETFKEYDYIIMNPPFSNGVEHVLKAIYLAEKQVQPCEVLAILNKETLNNAFGKRRQELLRKLDAYGAEIEYVSGAFTDAERKTDVEVALIRCQVMPLKDAGRRLYEDIVDSIGGNDGVENEAITTALSTEYSRNEIHERLNDIERLIIEYQKACELAKESYRILREKESFYTYVNNVNTSDDNRHYTDLSSVIPHNGRYTEEHLDEELARLRRAYWALILDTKDFSEILTNDGANKLRRQMEQAGNMEINVRNVQMLLTAINANKGGMLKDTLVTLFKKLTNRHMASFSSNVHYYDGWKTNDAFRINKKVIIPIQYSAFDSWDFRDEYSSLSYKIKEWIGDIVKAMRLINVEITDEFEFVGRGEFENEWLRFKMFNNGNIHIWFKDTDTLEKLNYICGQEFAWIPTDDVQKDDEEARKWVAKEFGSVGVVRIGQTTK